MRVNCKLKVTGVVDIIQPHTAQDMLWQVFRLVPLHTKEISLFDASVKLNMQRPLQLLKKLFDFMIHINENMQVHLGFVLNIKELPVLLGQSPIHKTSACQEMLQILSSRCN